MLIPAWHIRSFDIEPVRSKAYPFATMAYMGSMYMTVLLSFERYMAIRKGRKLTMKRLTVCISSVTIFCILYNLPAFWIWTLEENEMRKLPSLDQLVLYP